MSYTEHIEKICPTCGSKHTPPTDQRSPGPEQHCPKCAVAADVLIEQFSAEESEPRLVRVFEFRPGKRIADGGSKKWCCFPCVEDTWKTGKFHDPVVVPAADLKGCCCVICGKLVDRNGER